MARNPNPERRDAPSPPPAQAVVAARRPWDLTHNLFLPTLLFAALGGMTWAVRGCSGFGTFKGCIFAGVMWGTAWWFIARDLKREQSRRYASGWIILALAVGIGIGGKQGWMQWPSFFDGSLKIEPDESVPISRTYGFLWLFLSGAPWAGLGACFLAWTGSLRETRIWHWVIRIGLGLGVASLVDFLFLRYPQFFLPLYDTLKERYDAILEVMRHRRRLDDDLVDIEKLARDCRECMNHLGYVAGFLLFELFRRDWKNVALISTVGVVNGAGWALCQNWSWAKHVWPTSNFNFWRCWESSGGLSIGIAYGIAYFLVNRRMSDRERALVATRRATAGPSFEWLLIFSGLAMYLFPFVEEEFGPRRFVGIDLSFLRVRADANKWINGHLLGWSHIYFAIALLIAAAYYFVYRWSPVDGSPARRRGFAALANIEPVALLLVAALIAFLFLQNKMSSFLKEKINSDSSWVRWALGRNQMPFYLAYLGMVIVVGIIWYAVRRRTFDEERRVATPIDGDPNVERFGLYLGLLAGLGTSIVNGSKGWFNIYKGHENEWFRWLWHHLGPVFALLMVAIGISMLFRPLPRNFRGNIFPHAYGWMWLVLIVQNVIAQLVTSSPRDFIEMTFALYYGLLFFITAAIVVHYHWLKSPLARAT